jgi:3D (Asp-Asp-Asp) domain-containing protein
LLTRLSAFGLILTLAGTAAAEPEKVGKALVTFYWVADESLSRYRGEANEVLRDPRGRVIARTTRRFKLDLIKQGSGWLRDGRTVVYIKSVKGESRFRVTKSKYGLGSTGCPLIPFETIAVDPHFVKLGSRVYIPALKGAKLPDGTIHDGMFIASDRGHFRGKHVDFFVGAGSREARPFIRKGYASQSHVTVYVDGKATGCR